MSTVSSIISTFSKIYCVCAVIYLSLQVAIDFLHTPLPSVMVSSTLNHVIIPAFSKPLHWSDMAPVSQQWNCRLLHLTWAMGRNSLVRVFFFHGLSRCLLSLRPILNGEHIEPNGLRGWLCRRGLHWLCFCPLKTAEPMSCKIVHGRNGNVSAYCGQFPSRCGFRSRFAFFWNHIFYSFFSSESVLASYSCPSWEWLF